MYMKKNWSPIRIINAEENKNSICGFIILIFLELKKGRESMGTKDKSFTTINANKQINSYSLHLSKFVLKII